MKERLLRARAYIWAKRDHIVAFLFGMGPRERRQIAVVFLTCAMVVAYCYVSFYRPPGVFPVRTILTIPEGMNLTEAAEYLAAHGVVRSPGAFRNAVWLMQSETNLKAGAYFFERPLSVVEVAQRLIAGNYGLRPVKVRIPEGATTYEIGAILERKLGTVDAETFTMLARPKEGYLYPDTYFFLPNASISQIIDVMERNFYAQLEPLATDILNSGKTLHEIVTMASLLEKEARWLDERRMIAGILWNRIGIGMPLQVDAVFGYINSTSTFHPKFSDLRVDSPYNTYKYKGLPPGPIASPSLVSIEAAATPQENDYLFYLTGRDGNMYYSENFKQHVDYKYRYLK
jgi:UPF0755 protein